MWYYKPSKNSTLNISGQLQHRLCGQYFQADMKKVCAWSRYLVYTTEVLNIHSISQITNTVGNFLNKMLQYSFIYSPFNVLWPAGAPSWNIRGVGDPPKELMK
jgi:hypothetical protein